MGPDLSTPATEEAPLAAHTYAYGIHKMEADRVVQQRAPGSARMQRLHFAAPYFCRCEYRQLLHGSIPWHSRRRQQTGRENASRRKTASLHVAIGRQVFAESLIQFVQIDDVARLVAFILSKNEPEGRRLTILNVAGRGGR